MSLCRPTVGPEEAAAIARVLTTGVYTNGPETAAFEREFARLHEVEHAVAVANGTVGLAAMLLAHDIGPGDEVIVPSLTFFSTATSVLHVGATPVFADILPGTYDLDPDDVAARLTPRTRAIMPVHYGGQPADLPRLTAVAERAGVLLLEDAAQAHGARLHGRPAGSWGAAAMFSFTPTKNITTGEGGIVVTPNAAVADRLRLLRNHGMTGPYHHEIVGYNWRLTEFQAAMGVVQLGRLPGILDRKRANAAWLGQRLAEVPGVTPPGVRSGAEHVYMLYTVTLDPAIDRDAVLTDLRASGVEAKLYFPPAHRQPPFAIRAGDDGRLGDGPAELPVTDDLAGRILSLPFHAGLTTAELDFMVDQLAATVTRNAR